jgi:hypothetical protein
VLRAQAEERPDPLPERAAPEAPQQELLIGAGIDDGRIADGIHAAGEAGIDLPERDLVADVDRRFEPGAAGSLQVRPRRVGIEPRGQHALANEVVVLGMLDDGARHGVAEPHALELVFVDYAFEGGGQHVLIADGGVCAVCAGEGNPDAADDGDPSDCGTYEHGILPRQEGR